MVLCVVQGCDADAYFKIMFYHFDRIHKKPFCREIIMTCENHAKLLGDKNTITVIQVLS